ncbi:MAG: hypothetical protein GC154_05320 [bacterium]|nr:hypothetical protein [bacterium]
MTQKNIMAFGEILWDRLPSGKQLGGAPFNFVYRTKTLGHRGLMVSRLGEDELGDEARRKANELGMDDRLIERDPQRPTGTVDVKLDNNGQPDYTINPDVAYDFIECGEETLQEASRMECICYGTLGQRSAASRSALNRLLNAAPNALKLYDINLRKNCYTREIIQASMQRAGLVKLNEDEAGELNEMFTLHSPGLIETANALVERWGLKACVVTLGDRGAFAVCASGDRAYQPGYKVEMNDPCGSGDAFTAAFLDAWLNGQPLAECCRKGNALGALVATQSGATEPIEPERLNEFLNDPPDPILDQNLLKHCIGVI